MAGINFSIYPSEIINKGEVKKALYLENVLSEIFGSNPQKILYNNNYIGLLIGFDLAAIDTFEQFNDILIIKKIIKESTYPEILCAFLSHRLRGLKIIRKTQVLLDRLGYNSFNDFLEEKVNDNVYSFSSCKRMLEDTIIGRGYRVYDVKTAESFPVGNILICNRLDSLYIHAIKRAFLIITEDTSTFVHTVLICEELKKKMIFGARGLFFSVKDGDEVVIKIASKEIEIVRS